MAFASHRNYATCARRRQRGPVRLFSETLSTHLRIADEFRTPCFREAARFGGWRTCRGVRIPGLGGPSVLLACGLIRGHSDKAERGFFTRGAELSVVWGDYSAAGGAIRVCEATIPHGLNGSGPFPSPSPSAWGSSSPEIPNPLRPSGGELGSPLVQVHSGLALGNCRPTPPFSPLPRPLSHANGAPPTGSGEDTESNTGISYYSVLGGRYVLDGGMTFTPSPLPPQPP